MRVNLVYLNLFISSFAFAGESGIQAINTAPGYRPLLTLQGGYANVKAGQSQVYLGEDTTLFSYFPYQKNKGLGFIGGFTGFEHVLLSYPLSAQLGLEYNYFSPYEVSGLHTAGVEPSTSTSYNYNYRLQTQQLMLAAKLLARNNGHLHPYVALGLGSAFNTANRYTLQSTETGNLNLSPVLQAQHHSSFSYNLGLGAEMALNQQLRLGLGYRFSDFGKSTLGQGVVSFNNYQSPVGFTLESRHAYANQLLAQLSYLA